MPPNECPMRGRLWGRADKMESDTAANQSEERMDPRPSSGCDAHQSVSS